MSNYTVTRFNRWTSKTSIKTVAAENAMVARASHAAMSNHMMANGWGVTKVQDSTGATVYEFKG